MATTTETQQHLLQQGQLGVPELELFYDEGFVSDVLYQLKSGKEATAYCCAAGSSAGGLELLAAKVYRPLDTRGFRNDGVYQTNRLAGADKRVQRAFAQKSRFGRELQYSGWVEHEYGTLKRLWEAGADVPQPVMQSREAVLMAFIGDRDGPAPQLRDVRLERDEAQLLFNRLIENVGIFLACDRVHGDLSAFNILYWEGQAVIIDVPQSVDPDINPHAYSLLERDLTNLVSYFQRYGVRADPARLAGELWAKARFGG